MENFISKLLDFNKIPTKLLFLLSMVSGCLLFLPSGILESLKLTKFETEYGKYFGIAFLISSGILIMNFLIWAIKKILVYFFSLKYNKNLKKELYNLDEGEQAVLREFLINNKSAVKLPIDDPIVKNLLNKRIIVRISTIGEYAIGGMLFPIKMNDKIKNEMSEEVIGISKFRNDEEKRNFIFNSRPDWALEMEKFKSLF